MTTIAWDGATLAADRRASGDGFAYVITKIRRCADGRLIGGSGSISAVVALLDWLELGGIGDAPVKLDSDAWGDLIEIRPDGTVCLWGEYGRFPIHDRIAAIGSGMAYALGAMAAGKKADAAVAIAAAFDPKTGASIETLPLHPRKTHARAR